MTTMTREAPLPLGVGYFEPCALMTLGQYMIDGTWLDIKTDEGLVQRVRIVEIVVRVYGEDVVVRQEWLEGEGDDVKRLKHQFALDSESVWKVLPSNVHIEDVRPWCYDHEIDLEVPGHEKMDDEMTVVARKAILANALTHFKLTLEELCGKTERNVVLPRHCTVLVFYEMTDLSPLECCKAVGYKSVQPLMSARVRTRTTGRNVDTEFRAVALPFARLCDAVLGREYRTRRALGDYCPLLTHAPR